MSRSALVLAALLTASCSNPGENPPARVPAQSVVLRYGGLIAHVSESGVRLSTGTFESRWSTRAFGRGSALKASPVRRLSSGSRVTLDRAGLREWWLEDGRRVEFGYDVAERPEGEGPLSIAIATSGDGRFRASSEGAVAFLEKEGSAPLLELLDLSARDSLGRTLPARFRDHGGELTIEVDDSNARYPIVIDPTVVTGIETKLSLTGAGAAKFGPTLALSPDGNHLLAKNTADNTIVFHDFAAGSWTNAGSVSFPTASGGADEFGSFGDALAFAGDNSPLISCYRFKYSSLNWAGAFFAYDLARAYQTTVKPTGAASDDQFGFSMAAEGNSIIVGARSTSGFTSAAYVFTHTSGTTYTQQAKLTQPPSTNYFGWTVAIQGDDALVGVLNQRTTYAYRRTGTTWSAGAEIKPTGLVTGDEYGLEFAVGGKVVLVGASGKQITTAGDGQVYVYKDTGTAWTAEGPMFTAPPTGAAGGGLGSALAISPDGTTAFVGAPRAASGEGRVYILTRSGTAWTLARTLAPSDKTTTGFGSNLALSGTRLAVAAPASGTATASFVYVFDPALGLAPAAKCAGALDCASGFCIDGVCCDTACTGTCEACNVSGKEGTCSPVKGAPVSPRAACPATGEGPCASTCDGVKRDACTLPDSKVSCGAATCNAAGGVVGIGSCDGAGKCQPPAATSCAPFLCAEGACKTSCKLDTECAEGARCTGGTCVVGIPDAGPSSTPGLVKTCKADSECSTGFCADGVCCDQPCKDKCSSCAVPGFVGKCLAESGIDLRNDCNAASCTTTCQAGECRPVRAGDQCAPSLCVDIHTAQGPSTCSAAGAACSATTGTLDCSPYVCALGTCLTSCIDSTQCIAGTVCDTAQQRCVTAPVEDEGGCAIGEPGASGTWAFAAITAALALLGASRRRSAS